MTALEARLRTELPELADHLTAVDSVVDAASPLGNDAAVAVDVALARSPDERRRSRRRWPVAAVAAAMVLTAIIAVAVRAGDDGVGVATGATAADGEQSGSATALPPAHGGSWAALPDAPIEPRPYAVSVWTGTEAVFWAGSNLERNFAYSDGAAFDPATRTWRPVPGPGWGHPGLTGAVLDGEVYMLAKGSGTRFDPAQGTWTDLPQVEGIFLTSTVATNDAIWGLGPADRNPSGQPDLAIVRYDPSTDAWISGPVFEPTDGVASIVTDLIQVEASVHWDGSEIIAWAGVGGVAFDPVAGTWRTIDDPVPPDGRAAAGISTVTEAGLTVLFDVEGPLGLEQWVGIFEPAGWRWLELPHAGTDLDATTVAGAGEWLVIFSPLEPPITVHTPSGAWFSASDAPALGAHPPNTVWTGGELVVWGAVPEDEAVSPAVAWTPPDR